MKRFICGVILLLATAPVWAGTALFVREIRGSGMYKQCVYNYLGNRYVITVPSTQICPVTIQVP